MKMRSWLLAFATAALFLGAGLTIFLRDWVREAIVRPIVYFFWAIGLMLQTIDQAVYWGLLIAFCAFVALYALWPEPARGGKPEISRPGNMHTRYHQWYAFFNNLDESRFAAESLAREFVRFTVMVLAYQENVSPDEVYRQIDSGELPVPPDFLAFLRRREFVNKPVPEPAWREFIYQYLPRRRAPHGPDQLTPIEQEAAGILKHIEALLAPQEFLETADGQPPPQHANS
jgi:hypothetical protein